MLSKKICFILIFSLFLVFAGCVQQPTNSQQLKKIDKIGTLKVSKGVIFQFKENEIEKSYLLSVDSSIMENGELVKLAESNASVRIVGTIQKVSFTEEQRNSDQCKLGQMACIDFYVLVVEKIEII